MTRITITLSDQEKIALRALAEKELRDPRDQVAFILRKELEERGFIKIPNPVKVSTARVGQAMNFNYKNLNGRIENG